MDLHKKEEDILSELERPKARVTIRKRKKVISAAEGRSSDVNLSKTTAKKGDSEAQATQNLSENAKNA